MREIPGCIPEIVEMVLASANLVSDDVFIHKRVVAKILGVILERDDEENSLELALECLRAAYTTLGVKDPYDNEKARLNRVMNGLGGFFTDYIDAAKNRIEAGARLALAASGNAIRKLGREEMEKVLASRLSPDAPKFEPNITESTIIYPNDNIEALTLEATKVKTVLYIADSAGELSADLFFIAELAKTAQVDLCVTRQPILLRATATDIEGAQLPPNVNVIDPGADMLGISLDRASTAFREKFNAAELVISKGGINWQSLRNTEREVFYLFRAEQPQVAKQFGVQIDGGVITTRAAE